MATIHDLPLPATPATPRPDNAYTFFRSLGVSPSDALWLCGGPGSLFAATSEALALDLSVRAILEAAQP